MPLAGCDVSFSYSFLILSLTIFLSALCSDPKSAAAGLKCLTYVYGVVSSFSFSDSLLLLYFNDIGVFNVSDERELTSFLASEDDF